MYAGVLRRARNEVIPEIPELVPQIPGNQSAIRDRLRTAVADQDFDPNKVELKDWNKAERHTISGFLIDALTDDRVDGHGREAVFPWMDGTVVDGQPWRYEIELQRGLDDGRRNVQNAFSFGKDPQHKWYNTARLHYTDLGIEAKRLARQSPNMRGPITLEGTDLWTAIGPKSFRTFMFAYTKLIGRRMPDATPEEKLRAAHDLTALLTTNASQHVERVIQGVSFGNLPIRISLDGIGGNYKADRTTGTMRQLYDRSVPLPDATLKCPAHAALASQEGGETNLNRLIHAGVNAAGLHGAF